MKKAAAGAGAVGATAFGAVADPGAQAPDVPRRWDTAADVVVIGAGAAGLAAAIEAARHGASVIIVEQNYDVGGHAIQSGARIELGGGTSLQKKYGIIDSPDRLFSDLASHPDYRYNDRDLLRAFAEWAVSTFDWLIANGVVFPDEPPIGGRSGRGLERTHVLTWTGGIGADSPTGAAGTALIRPLEAAARKLGVEVLLEHSMTRIISEVTASRRVLGITATTNGRTLTVHARKGVIIGTGGHTSNVNFRRTFDPRLTEEYQVSGEPYSRQTGDGEIAAMRVGASLWGAANQTLERGSVLMKPSTIGSQFGYMRAGRQGNPMALTNSPIFKRIRALGLTAGNYENVIQVNQAGVRLVNEEATGYEWFNPCLALNGGRSNGGGPVWAIFDSEGAKRENWVCEPPHVDPDGWFFSGGTLEELARRITGKYQKQPMPPAALQAAVARYNSFVDAGTDAEFAKPTLRFKIQTPPFHAAWSAPVVHDSLTGLRIDAKSQVLDLDGEVIPGLYCAGESAGGFSQHGLGRSMVQGRIAGREAARRPAADRK